MTLVEFICTKHKIDLQHEYADFKSKGFEVDYYKVMVKAAFEAFGTTEKELKSDTRKREIVMQRHSIMYFLHHTKRFSFSAIGRIFLREHSTVMTAIKKVNNYLSYKDEMFLNYFEPIENAFNEASNKTYLFEHLETRQN